MYQFCISHELGFKYAQRSFFQTLVEILYSEQRGHCPKLLLTTQNPEKSDVGRIQSFEMHKATFFVFHCKYAAI